MANPQTHKTQTMQTSIAAIKTITIYIGKNVYSVPDNLDEAQITEYLGTDDWDYGLLTY